MKTETLKGKSGKIYLVIGSNLLVFFFFNMERKKEIGMHKINGEQVKI